MKEHISSTTRKRKVLVIIAVQIAVTCAACFLFFAWQSGKLTGKLRLSTSNSTDAWGWLYSDVVPPELACNETQVKALWNQSCVPMLVLPSDIHPVPAFRMLPAAPVNAASAAPNSYYTAPVLKPQQIRFHWVIKSCPRAAINRYLLSSLLSGIFNDLGAATISIVWCKPVGSTVLPAMIYNLRRSRSINIFHVPESLSMYKHIGSTLTAFQVPEMLGHPELPLLITEDDVLYTEDANTAVSAALNAVKSLVDRRPFVLNLYHGTDPGTRNVSATSKDSDFQKHPCEDIPMDSKTTTNITHTAHNVTVITGSLWGTQCQLYSGAMTKMLARHLYMNYRALAEGRHDTIEYQTHFPEDLAIMEGLQNRMSCNQGGPCHAFIIQPSLVQHVGAYTTHFKDGPRNNARFHVAANFPMHVRFPIFEDHTQWAR